VVEVRWTGQPAQHANRKSRRKEKKCENRLDLACPARRRWREIGRLEAQIAALNTAITTCNWRGLADHRIRCRSCRCQPRVIQESQPEDRAGPLVIGARGPEVGVHATPQPAAVTCDQNLDVPNEQVQDATGHAGPSQNGRLVTPNMPCLPNVVACTVAALSSKTEHSQKWALV